MSHDIRAHVGAAIDTAIDAVAHPGDRIYWDMLTSIIAQGGAMTVSTVIVLATPSPILGRIIRTVKEVDPIALGDGDHALDLVRELVENLRSMRAQELGLQVPE
jgi:hypothetical protein